MGVGTAANAGAKEGRATGVADRGAPGVSGTRTTGDPTHALVARATSAPGAAGVGTTSDAGASLGRAAGAPDGRTASGGAAGATSDAARDLRWGPRSGYSERRIRET